MMANETLEKLRKLKLWGMLQAFEEQMKMPDITEMSFEDRLGLLIDREETDKNNKRTQSRLKSAKLKDKFAIVEDIDFKASRGLDRKTIMSLAGCDWIRHHQNLVLTGPTGVGKGYIASALIQRACMEGFSALFIRVSRLLSDLSIARVEGRYYKVLSQFAKTDVVIFDDWGQPLSETERRDFLEIIEDRYGSRSTIITSQIPIEDWPGVI
ncbi:MAG: ATP-binding protein [Oligoflexales bacterium]|nr:ATP-binding protein [Oligoflexales bacterium]